MTRVGSTFVAGGSARFSIRASRRRVARTPHYDGVKKGAEEPVVIGIFGMAPVDLKLVDPRKPVWRLA